MRVQIDRKSGEVAVLAQELGPDGEVVHEWDDTPTDFGRIAASTAKQVIVQRLRDAENEQTFGEYAGKEGDIVSGIVQAHDRRNVQGTVLVDIDDDIEQDDAAELEDLDEAEPADDDGGEK